MFLELAIWETALKTLHVEKNEYLVRLKIDGKCIF